jgi:hypothetical protein
MPAAGEVGVVPGRFFSSWRWVELPPPLFRERKENGGGRGRTGRGQKQEEVILGAFFS